MTQANQIERENLSGDAILTRSDSIYEMLGMVVAVLGANIDENIFESLTAIGHRVHRQYIHEELSSRAGRPHLDTPREAPRTLVLSGITVRSIANMFGVSPTIESANQLTGSALCALIDRPTHCAEKRHYEIKRPSCKRT